LTVRVLIACVVVGLLTGLAAALVSVNVDKLWRASVKRNAADTTRPFSYAAAWRDGAAYVQGELALEKGRGNRWSVVTADGKQTLGVAPNEDEARRLKADLEEMIALGGMDTIAERDGAVAVLSADRSRILARFHSRADAEARLAMLAEIGRDQASQQRRAWLALFLGLTVGSGGTLAVWPRSRRTPEVIALRGIARTFQNIRLFGNMTALENVLTAMDRYLRGGLPGVGREEAAARRRTAELLAFVGLEADAHRLAK